MSDSDGREGTRSPGFAGQGNVAKVNPRLLEILVCPVTKGTLDYDAARQELVSRSAKLAYPIRDGIPIMLVDEARPIEDGER